jgi:hypothetical protein
MEILRFDAEPTPARKSRRSIKGVFVVGLVAATFGIGSAFATSTITVNDNNTVQLGQGVTAVTACDNAISVVPVSSLDSSQLNESVSPSALPDAFAVGSIEIGKVAGAQEISNACNGKDFKIQIFDNVEGVSAPLSCDEILGETGLTVPTRIYSEGGYFESSDHVIHPVCDPATKSIYVRFNNVEVNYFVIFPHTSGEPSHAIGSSKVDYITLETTSYFGS